MSTNLTGNVTGFILALLAMSPSLITSTARAQEKFEKLFIPMGGGYSEILTGFSAAVISHAQGKDIEILVLPIAYATNHLTISQSEREQNLQAAEMRRTEIEAACKVAASSNQACRVVLAPVFTRQDAELLQVSKYFPPQLTSIFLLGGDQTVAMQVIIDTPVEKAMKESYLRGVIIAGTSAGCAIQSAAMLAGYKPGYEAGNSLDFGAVEIWDSSEKHGLSFGLGNAILDQHFYQHGRMGRLLNTIAMPDVPHIGIGIDAYTGVHVIDNKTIENVFGLFTITILDGESYHSADSVQYRGPRNLLSLRNILVHILSPGEFSYDLSTKHHSLANPPEKLNRQFNSLKLPENAGSLILSGNLGTFLPGDPILNRFVNLSGGHNAKLLAIAAGYPSTQEANNAIDQLSAALPVPFQSLIIKQDTFKPIELPEGMTGIILIGKDQSLVPVHLLTPVIKAWRSGTTLLSDDAASAVIGSYYSAHPPSPQDEMMAEAATQKSFLIGNTVIRQGLGLLDVTLESRILENNRWGRFFSLAYNHPELLAIGLPDHTALEITQNNPAIVGDNVAFILDLRSAKLDLGTNQGFVIANGLLDVFAPGEILQPELADINRAPVRIGTPVLPTLTSTITATPIETPIPAEISQVEIQPLEQTPPSIPEKNTRPTPTPLVIPPPADPGKAKLIILGGAMAALIVLIGVLINRRLVN